MGRLGSSCRRQPGPTLASTDLGAVATVLILPEGLTTGHGSPREEARSGRQLGSGRVSGVETSGSIGQIVFTAS